MKVKSEMLFFLEFCHTYTVFEEVSKQGIEEYGYKSVFLYGIMGDCLHIAYGLDYHHCISPSRSPVV